MDVGWNTPCDTDDCVLKVTALLREVVKDEEPREFCPDRCAYELGGPEVVSAPPNMSPRGAVTVDLVTGRLCLPS